MTDNFCDDNIREIEALGFINMNFGGYGGIGFKNGDLQIWIDDWGYTRMQNLIREVYVGDISEELLKDKFTKAMDELS